MAFYLPIPLKQDLLFGLDLYPNPFVLLAFHRDRAFPRVIMYRGQSLEAACKGEAIAASTLKELLEHWEFDVAIVYDLISTILYEKQIPGRSSRFFASRAHIHSL